jgi:hypothetical protein
MKQNFSQFLGFTFLLVAIPFFSSMAQEGIPVNEIPDINFHPETNDDKPLLFEPDKSTSNSEKSNQQKEQATTATKTGKAKVGDPKNPGTKNEDDALSFNFLYYIIQKFKISDIVEQ